MNLENIRRKLRFSNRVWAWVLGTGLVLFVVHNPALIHRESSGAVDIFLPIVGFGISAIAISMILPKVKITMGSKYLYIPLLIILASISITGFVNAPAYSGDIYAFIRDGIAPTIIAAYLLGIYVTCRSVGEDVFKPFMYAVIIETVSLILMSGSGRGGGIISPTNYDIAAGFLVFGAVVFIGKNQWKIAMLAIGGVFLTGAEEGLFALGVLLVAVLARRDFGKRLVPVGIVSVLLIAAMFTPQGAVLYHLTAERLDLAQSAIFNRPYILDHHDALKLANHLEIKVDGKDYVRVITRDEKLEIATGYRWLTHWNISEIKPFGHGYIITAFYKGIPHNMVLIIIEQVGILAALAWLWVVGYCLFKTRWKYAWLAIIALSVWDHYLWTMAAPWWWAVVGVSTTSQIKNDLIFRS